MKRDDELPNAMELVNCLLEVDKSDEVVGNALFGCIDGYADADSEDEAVRNGRLLGVMEMLLKANSEAAKYRESNGYNLLHQACLRSLPSKLCIDIMKLVLALDKDAVHEARAGGWLPVLFAAHYCDVEVLEFLLGSYAGAASAMSSGGDNLLHLAVSNRSSGTVVSAVQYLCLRYPAMILQSSGKGHLPVHKAASRGCAALPVLYEAGGIEQFRMPIAHPTDATNSYNGHLPLYLFILLQYNRLKMSSHIISEAADMFRWLLRLYPEAAGIEGGVGAHKKTPYQLAVDRQLPDYFLRLLLRAAPTLHPVELHRLNYKQRRMAMFLAFRAAPATLKAPLLARLRGENRDLVQRVVSFL